MFIVVITAVIAEQELGERVKRHGSVTEQPLSPEAASTT